LGTNKPAAQGIGRVLAKALLAFLSAANLALQAAEAVDTDYQMSTAGRADER
jgi:hypothetical protein